MPNTSPATSRRASASSAAWSSRSSWSRSPVSPMSGNAETRTIDGLAVTLYGPADGAPVLMSAGLGAHGAHWQPQIPALAARDFRVILYDHRGTGASARAPLPSPYTSRNLA